MYTVIFSDWVCFRCFPAQFWSIFSKYEIITVLPKTPKIEHILDKLVMKGNKKI